MTSHYCLIAALLLLRTISASWLFGKKEQSLFPSEYGVDVTYPIHHEVDRSLYAQYSDRYLRVMQGCYEKYSRSECDSYERDRLAMNREQPRTQHNYTQLGFKKTTAPALAWEPLLAFFNENRVREKEEKWPRGNTYVNSWDSPTSIISPDDRSLRGAASNSLKDKIWEGVRPVLEEWVGHKLMPTSLYGVRIYKHGSVLAPHVDRLPLVTSCIINVAQDVNEPWPIEVYDHSGRAHNITMQPGDMVLYESHTVIHGRPFPLNGKFYANVFVHFQPIDHDAMNAAHNSGGEEDQHVSISKHIAGHEQSNHKEDPFRRKLDRSQRGHRSHTPMSKQQLELRRAALANDRGTLEKLFSISEYRQAAEEEDENKWRLFHEAARGSDLETIKFLVEKKIDYSATTKTGKNALQIAKEQNREKEIVEYFESLGIH